MKKTPTERIDAMVQDSCGVYQFRRRGDKAKGDLVRMDLDGRRVEQLIDGCWIPTTRLPAHDDLKVWKPMKAEDLSVRVRRFLLPDLNLESIASKPGAPGRFLRGTRIWGWLVPPLQAGAPRKLKAGKVQKRCRSAYVNDLRKVKGDDLLKVESQILAGYEAALDRISRVEQRAGVFLGASVLTSSLVLGNASLLLSNTDRLETPYLQIAAGALAIASACAIIGAFRAVQTTLFTFSRAIPTSAKKVLERRTLRGEHLTRDYVAALFVATDRAATIGDWKVNQLKAARRWILVTTSGVVVLTIVVLVDAVWR